MKYRLSIEPPNPPVLNQTVKPGLVPVRSVTIVQNGAPINVTIYRVNETVIIGNVTVVVFGYVSRLGIEIHIGAFGVPPGSYAVNITGLAMNKTVVEYVGTLHVYLHYQAPENQLIPENTVIKMMIRPLSLTIIVPVEG